MTLVDQPPPNEETVEALVENLRDFLDTEDALEQSINTRGGGVVVFGGIILSLLASLGRTVLVEDLPDGWDEASAVLFALAVVALLTSVSMTLFLVLLPRQSASIAIEEIEQYGEATVLAQPRIEAQGVLLEGLIRILAIDRARVSRKTRWLAGAYMSLVVALFAVGGLGAILGTKEAGLLISAKPHGVERSDPRLGRTPPPSRLGSSRPFSPPLLDRERRRIAPAISRPFGERDG